MSRRSANPSRFAGTSNAPQGFAGDYGQGHSDDIPITFTNHRPDVDDGSYPLRPLSRNKVLSSRTDIGIAGEGDGGSTHRSLLRSADKSLRKPNDRRKSRLSDADQEDDGYTQFGAGDGQAEQDQLLLTGAGLDGSWPSESSRFPDTVDEQHERRFSVSPLRVIAFQVLMKSNLPERLQKQPYKA